MTGIVYNIKVDGVIRYIGYTDNLKRRKSQHMRSLKIGDEKKYLYKKINELMTPTIEIEVSKEFDNKGDAKRWEAYLILHDYFNNKELWQSFPISFKYF